MSAHGALSAFVNPAASSTDFSVVAASGTARINVLAVYSMAAGTATTLVFNSKGSGSGTAISASFANGANGGEVLPFNPKGWFTTNAGEALTVSTGSGSATGVGVVYELVT